MVSRFKHYQLVVVVSAGNHTHRKEAGFGFLIIIDRLVTRQQLATFAIFMPHQICKADTSREYVYQE